uniref:BTB domain-containing protein n=1 Tax=Anopheles minimus TaxID=112268 RepID=A0A182WDY9_9DIPT
MSSSEGQTYCLRWNNHKSNLVEILDALIKMECYVDCTIYVDDQVQFKAHRVVLAANSPYFQTILQDVPMDHCSILFPGVQEFEMRALLEYMYTGEVNVTQAQIPRIMKIAEQLEVKGLYDMADLKGRFNKMVDVDHLMRDRDPATTLLASNNNYSSKGSSTTGFGGATASSSSWKDAPPTSSSSSGGGGGSNSHYSHHQHQHQSSPVISTSTNISIAQSSSSSPPYAYKSPYSSLYSRSPGAVERDREREERSRDRSSSFSHTATSPHRIQSTSGSSASSVSAQIALQAQGGNHQSSTHQSSSSSSATSVSSQPSTAAAAAALAAGWPGLGQTQLHSMLSSAYDSSTDMNPLKRKKLQSMSSMLRDTPILRNVLAQANPADSSQTSGGGVPAGAAATVATIQTIQGSMKQDPERPSSHHSNGSGYKSIKEQSHSPYADKSFDDDLLDSPHNFSGDARLASYVPHQQQKPEWKRYKQYTRTDILNAIECVRKGMSALQASRKFGVPSRTLYDKVKKLGITTGRPINRALKRSPSSSGSPASFPYGLSGASHMFGPGSGAPGGSHPGDHHQQMPSQSQQQDDEASAAAAAAAAAAMAHHEAGRMIKLEHGSHHGLPPTIPHPAAALLDPSFLQQALEARGGDIAGREALHAMAFAAAAHAAVNGMSTSPGTHGTARSPSPSVLMKYMRSVSMSSPEDDRHHPVQHQQRERERDLAEGHPHRDGHHHNGSDPVYARRDHPMEQDSIDNMGSDCGERPPSGPGPVEGQDDHVEDLSMGPKRDSEERGASVSPPPSSVVRATQRSRSPSPQPAPPSLPPQQQGVIVPAPGKLKEDYNIPIKREIIADSNAPSESS